MFSVHNACCICISIRMYLSLYSSVLTSVRTMLTDIPCIVDQLTPLLSPEKTHVDIRGNSSKKSERTDAEAGDALRGRASAMGMTSESAPELHHAEVSAVPRGSESNVGGLGFGICGLGWGVCTDSGSGER